MSFKEDEIVMCMVKRIEGTIIFVNIDGDGEGTIAMSEIAAGRIRNLREYVFPNKRIVCKVLSVDKDGHQHLSLRRVTGKEREEMQERYKKEKTLASILKTVSKSPQESIKLKREKYVKKICILKTNSDSGLLDIKEILNVPDVNISYLGSSKFSLAAKGSDFKNAEHKVEAALALIEKKAKEKKAHFEVKEK